jgi:phosphoribosylanthranilate isomerase
MKDTTFRRPIKIKVCGMVHAENVEAVCALDPDFVGYIFYRGSSRFVGDDPDPALFRIPGARTARVGVFVNEELPEVMKKFNSCTLDLVQLHGSESPEYCGKLVEEGIPVMKVLHPGNGNSRPDRGDLHPEPDRYAGVAHYLLFDSGASGTGGSGEKFEWDLLREVSIPLPFLLGGGIGPEDADALMGVDFPQLYGVDVNSRFETAPGMKDTLLLKRFMDEVRGLSDIKQR